jgi:hypothetical protein
MSFLLRNSNSEGPIVRSLRVLLNAPKKVKQTIGKTIKNSGKTRIRWFEFKKTFGYILALKHW